MVERFLETARQGKEEERNRRETERRIKEGAPELYAGLLQLLKDQGERVRGKNIARIFYFSIAPIPKLIWGEGPSALADWRRFSQTLNGTGEPVKVVISSSDATRRPGHILISSEGFPYYWEISNRGVGWRTLKETKPGRSFPDSQKFILEDIKFLESLLEGLKENPVSV